MPKRVLAVFSGVALALVLASCGGGVGTTMAQLGALQVALTEVQKVLTSTVAQADDAAKNRIAQVDTVAKDNIKRLDGLIKDAGNTTAVQREEAARQAFNALSEARKLVEESGLDMFAGVNQALANVSTTLDAIPFVDVDDTIFAVSPYKIRKDASVFEVSLFGYFPSLKLDAAALKVSVAGKDVQVKRSVGRVYFDVPKEVIESGKALVDVKVQLPKRSFWQSQPTPVETRLRVLSATPYTFVIEARKDNPNAWETVSGNGRSESADSNNPNRNVHLQAEALFNTSVNNPRYDATTAQIIGVQVTGAGGGKACEDCPEPTGGVTGWTGSGVDIALSAPNCGSHLVGKQCDGPFGVKYPCPYMCGGGGSNYTVTIVPTFTARVKDVPESTPIETKNVTAGWKSVSTVDLPSDWASLLIKFSFNDNFDKGESAVVLKKAVPIAANPLFEARVENDKLILSTR